MSAGDVEIVKAMENVTTRNVRAAVEHGNKTREMLRELQEEVKTLRGQLMAKDAKINVLQTQVTAIQARLFAGGTQ